MRLLRRILLTAVVTLVVIFTVVRWAADVAFTFYSAKKVPAIARVVPTELRDHTISQAPGMRLSYLGYGFEVPWSDLDESKTEVYPKDKPDKTMVVLTFRSGLRLRVTAFPTGEWMTLFTTDFKLSPQQYEQFVGHEAAKSDYLFLRNLYEFTPDKMHYWAWPSAVHAHEAMVLMIKSIAPAKAAETGIFNVRNETFRGFQQGNPLARPDRPLVTLYSDGGNVEITLSQKDYKNPAGITQPEINRIVQSVNKIRPSEVAISKR
jgi:hypothetical protein